MEYKVENLAFLNMNKVRVTAVNPRLTGGMTIYEIEETLTEEEKLAFIDQMRDGIGTYLFELLTKWENEKDTLPTDSYGLPKTVSKKAWIKRNDPKGIVDNRFDFGRYWLFGTEFKDMMLICPKTLLGLEMEHTGKSIVHQWFHDLCDELAKSEKKYFKENDLAQIKLAQLVKLGRQYQVTFDNRLLNDIIWNHESNVTEEQLDIFLMAYDKLSRCIDDISEMVKNSNC